MSTFFRVIRHKRRRSLCAAGSTEEVLRGAREALARAVEEQEEKNLAWVMQMHSRTATPFGALTKGMTDGRLTSTSTAEAEAEAEAHKIGGQR